MRYIYHNSQPIHLSNCFYAKICQSFGHDFRLFELGYRNSSHNSMSAQLPSLPVHTKQSLSILPCTILPSSTVNTAEDKPLLQLFIISAAFPAICNPSLCWQPLFADSQPILGAKNSSSEGIAGLSVPSAYGTSLGGKEHGKGTDTFVCFLHQLYTLHTFPIIKGWKPPCVKVL